jgi:hypothetical protein
METGSTDSQGVPGSNGGWGICTFLLLPVVPHPHAFYLLETQNPMMAMDLGTYCILNDDILCSQASSPNWYPHCAFNGLQLSKDSNVCGVLCDVPGGSNGLMPTVPPSLL